MDHQFLVQLTGWLVVSNKLGKSARPSTIKFTLIILKLNLRRLVSPEAITRFLVIIRLVRLRSNKDAVLDALKVCLSLHLAKVASSGGGV